MLRDILEQLAALAALSLFLGCIAAWAIAIPALVR